MSEYNNKSRQAEEKFFFPRLLFSQLGRRRREGEAGKKQHEEMKPLAKHEHAGG